MAETFGARLRAATDARGQLCVGIDPHASLLAQWGLPDDPGGLERFTMTVVEALGDRVAVLKPQSAFYERHGSAGIAVLERAVRDARSAGALVLLDVKRGDIGSTASAYADAYLRPGAPVEVDAVTVSPYLGFGSLEPFLEAGAEHGKGVFVLARTSNPEGAEVQRALVDGDTVAASVLAQIRKRNAGATPLGSVGAVVGATIEHATEDYAINGPVLVPGFGAQGGTVQDLRRIFGANCADILPTTSRGVLGAGPDLDSLRAAAAAVAHTLESLTP